MRIISLFVFWILLVGFANAQLDSNIVFYPLGEDTIKLKFYSSLQSNDLYFIHVHENETASLEAGKRYVSKYGGKLLTLSHSDVGTVNRNVSFKYKKSTYQFDPNRIFSKDKNVLKNTIKKIKGYGSVNDDVILLVQDFGHTIWKEINSANLIIALHNNKNEPALYKRKWLFFSDFTPESYNITSYMKKFDVENSTTRSCSDIYVNPNINNSEFFIVTHQIDFNHFVNKRFNVVLQNQNPIDDGSLSVYSAKYQKRYINAEAKHGRVDEQWTMLSLLPK
ncbi:MAG: hypothetical protein R2774_15095 [Saprospiraceae bacterium]